MSTSLDVVFMTRTRIFPTTVCSSLGISARRQNADPAAHGSQCRMRRSFLLNLMISTDLRKLEFWNNP
jgi:hypothetical protein